MSQKRLGSLRVKSTKKTNFSKLYITIWLNVLFINFLLFCPMYVFLLNLGFFFPYFDHDAYMHLHHALHSLDALVWRKKIHISRFRYTFFDLIVTKYEIYKSRKCTPFGKKCSKSSWFLWVSGATAAGRLRRSPPPTPPPPH